MAGLWHIGVIGGSGLAAGIGIEHAQEIEVASPWGLPSGAVTTGTLEGVRFTFLPRHGLGHTISPAAVNYRANIDVLKRCGVTDLVALSAIGSLNPAMAPGHFVAVDQFIDRTTSRESSFFGPGLVAHVSMADPVCSRLQAGLIAAAKKQGATVHQGGCYVAIEGPQFSTRAESRLYQSWGAAVIGMTAMPEARLAREAELPYGLLGMVTDYDSWRESEAGVDAADVLQVMARTIGTAREVLRTFARQLPKSRSASPIDRALDHAVMTAPDHRDPALVARLQAVAGRVLG
ncbi:MULTISPECIES: S-methyl-5'-thioadenosine phosphorylase [unclassified Novosphingobium]|uniref:S-methyl-5'-thioadenosine phosphorylase n=1 Tax=unclassified Novosphingobium TaxID=2644732 RepID=UPI0025FDE9B8|nr:MULTISPECIES: S-methyl-5'-thioadenosine phosphorylase [unclassified Novosphingobium]HQV03424.1 S-methyl-5'-thioadenosine phosphorylase [Novosphingobium sp.]